MTVDEVGHLAAGVSHWEHGTYSHYRVNPPLPRMLATLPVVASSPNTEGIVEPVQAGERAEWPSGRRFAADNADRYHDLLFRARLVGITWALLGGCVVMLWARELYGPGAGWAAAALWCLEPTLFAHAQLVTPDVPATAAAITASYAFWRYLKAPSWEGAITVGILLGVALLTKFTLLVLYVVWPLLGIAYHFQSTVSLRSRLGQAAIIVLVSLAVVNLGYQAQGTFRPLGEIPFVSRTFAGEIDETDRLATGNRFRSSWVGHVPIPVPEDYLRGIDVQRRDFERLGRRAGSYLAGEWRGEGWWHYYLHALTVKVPLGLGVLFLWNVVLTLARHPACAPWRDELALALPALCVFVLISSQTGFNHHLRYVLPVFPFAIVSTAKLAWFARRQSWPAATAAAVLLSWAGWSGFSVHPHQLSYFNELAGGPERGHEHLLESNIDWGQDLPRLKEWLDDHPEARPMEMALCHVVDPRVVGLEFTFPSADSGPQPGYYAVSVNYVCGASTMPAPDGNGRFVAVPPRGYEYFQEFTPVARAGHSIWIYHITPDEANAVRRRLGWPPLPAPTPRPRAGESP